MIIARNYLEVYPYDKWNAKVNFITEIYVNYLPKTKFSPSNLRNLNKKYVILFTASTIKYQINLLYLITIVVVDYSSLQSR